MADIQHKNITDPEIHEPKGITSAAPGLVYVSGGSGTGAWDRVSPSDLKSNTANFNSVGTLLVPNGFGGIGTAPDGVTGVLFQNTGPGTQSFVMPSGQTKMYVRGNSWDVHFLRNISGNNSGRISVQETGWYSFIVRGRLYGSTVGAIHTDDFILGKTDGTDRTYVRVNGVTDFPCDMSLGLNSGDYIEVVIERTQGGMPGNKEWTGTDYVQFAANIMSRSA